MALRCIKKKTLVAACPSVNLGDVLGEGGNARVFKGKSATHGSVAVKFLLNDNTKRYSRFRDEVLVVTTHLRGSEYVLPILEYHLPESIVDSEVPWYVMPSARRLTDSLESQPWIGRIQALCNLAEGLAKIHSAGVAHRDIKPENLFELDGTFRFGDFGIAAFPDSSGVTSTNEPMGPWGYMAPEMLSSPTTADPYKADVYSFAKTIWAILSDQKIPFGGHYTPDSAIGLSAFEGSNDIVVEPLDSLLEASTRILPQERPSAQEFALKLRDAVTLQNDFSRANTLQWGAAEVSALKSTGLIRAVWEGPEEIAEVITILSRRHGLNHCFLPWGGGVTVDRASVCESGQMLALHLNSYSLNIVKPVRLTLERFHERPDFSYVVLETSDVTPLGEGNQFRDGESEYLKQINDYDYVLDDSNDDEPRHRNIGTPCQRYIKGGLFVLAPTMGVYNKIDDYAGNANTVGRDKLRNLFEQLFARINADEGHDTEWNPKRTVRLLRNADTANCQLVLYHLENGQLEKLVEIDDRLFEARKRDYKGPVALGSEELFAILNRKPSEEKQAARNLLEGFSNEQRAEYLTLIYLGRGDARISEYKEMLASNLSSSWEDWYLLEKIGNGYLRKALARFGLEVPPFVYSESSKIA